MKLCLSIEIQEGLSYAATLALTRAGEALGFDASLLAEHYYPSGPADLYPRGEQPMSADAWLYLAALARETSRIRLGTLVSPVTFRHPVVLAKMAATLDHLSGGRAELGIGAGWLEVEHTALGLEFAPPARRVDLVEEQLQIVTGLFSQDPFSHSGAAYQLRDAHFTPRPAEKPTIIVGGRTTSRRLTRLAGRYADEFVIGQPTPEDCREMRTRLDRACEAAGREPTAVRLSVFVPFCIGQTDQAVQDTLQAYRATNPQYRGMMQDNLARWLVGTPDQVRDRLDALGAAGVERVMVPVNSDLHLQLLPLLASAVG